MSTSTEQLHPAREGEKGASLLRIAIARSGQFKAAKVCAFATQWAAVVIDAGHELGEGQGIQAALDEYGAWWKSSNATNWRQLKAWREVFPEEESPARLVALALEQRAASRQTAAAGIGGLLVAV